MFYKYVIVVCLSYLRVFAYKRDIAIFALWKI